MHIKVFTGASGDFVLYEDDNETCAYEKGSCVKTSMSYREEKEEVVFEIRRPKGALGADSSKENVSRGFCGNEGYCKGADKGRIHGKEVQAVVSYNRKLQAVEVCVGEVSIEQEVRVVFTGGAAESGKSGGRAVLCISGSGGNRSFVEKDRIYNLVKNKKPAAEILAELLAQGTDRELYGVIAELLRKS